VHIRKKNKQTTLRQRLRPDQTESRRTIAQTFSYHTQRSDQTTNTGRDGAKFRNQVTGQLIGSAAKTIGNFWLQKFGLGILLLVGLASLVSALTLSSDVKLQQIGPANRSSLFHNQAAYQATAAELLNSSLLNHNKITIDSAKLSRELLARYPELASATLTLPLLSHRPIVYISYTQPALILHNGTGSFVLDTSGKVLAPTSSEAVVLGLPTVSDQSGFKLALNSQVLSSSDVSFIQTVVAGLQAKHVAITDMTLPTAANELDVAIGGKPYFVKFNLHAASAALQVGSFLAVQQRLTGENVTPAHYIDVRVDGRAYYQ
jgi:hypothetical protein